MKKINLIKKGFQFFKIWEFAPPNSQPRSWRNTRICPCSRPRSDFSDLPSGFNLAESLAHQRFNSRPRFVIDNLSLSNRKRSAPPPTARVSLAKSLTRPHCRLNNQDKLRDLDTFTPHKSAIILLFGIFLILIIISNISALGITPGRTTIDFSPNFEKEIKFSVINSEKKEMNIAFAIHGEPENIVSLDNEIVHFNSNEYSKDFSYKIKLPSDLPSGLHKIEIVAIELPEEIDSEEITVRTTLSVATQLYVYSPYPGKYLDSDMNIVGNERLILFYVPLINRGEEDINEVKGKIEIYQENKKITEIETNKISISSGERKELLGSFDSLNIPLGRYKAKTIIDYDGNQLEIEKEFEIGEEFIKILGVNADEFALGEVARIKILVQNKQQTKINKIYAEMNIYDENIIRVADLKSQDYEILELSNKEIIVYWDTKEVEEGKYASELKTNYDEKILTKNLKMDVSKNSIIFSGVGFAISNNNKNFNAKNFLIIIIGVLVLANALWFLWWLRKKEKER